MIESPCHTKMTLLGMANVQPVCVLAWMSDSLIRGTFG